MLRFCKHPSIQFMVAIVSEAEEIKDNNNTGGHAKAQLLDWQNKNNFI